MAETQTSYLGCSGQMEKRTDLVTFFTAGAKAEITQGRRFGAGCGGCLEGLQRGKLETLSSLELIWSFQSTTLYGPIYS